MNWKLIMSTIAAFVLGVTIVILTFYIGDTTTIKVLSLSIIVLGISIGWVIGIIISPYDTSESKQFSIFAKTLATFISGYLIGKIDKFIEEIFKPSFLFDSVNGFRMIAFVSVLLISMLITFIYRTYARV
jgi:D-alanyl-lipoteichoic acid acyltransferase DltB (MBOAT superfamily)